MDVQTIAQYIVTTNAFSNTHAVGVVVVVVVLSVVLAVVEIMFLFVIFNFDVSLHLWYLLWVSRSRVTTWHWFDANREKQS